MAINYNDIISQAQKEWADAHARGDQNAKNIAHLKAENARKAMGYSGGSDGSQKIAIDSGVQQKYDNAYKTAYSYAGNHNIDPRYIDDYANNDFTRSNAIVQGAIKNKANAYDIDGSGNYSGSNRGSTGGSYDFDKDSYFNSIFGGIKGQLDSAYASQLNAINNALTRALSQTEGARVDVNNDFTNRQNAIQQNAYQDIQRGKVVGANRGVMNSMQQMAMEGDTLSRENSNHASNAQVRDTLMTQITNRVNELNSIADQDRITLDAKRQADLAKAEYDARLRAEEMAMNRSDRYENREWQIEDRDIARQYQLDDRQASWDREDAYRAEDREWYLSDKADDRQWQQDFATFKAKLDAQYSSGASKGLYSNTDGQYYNATKGYIGSLLSGVDAEGNRISLAEQKKQLTAFANDMLSDPLYNQNTHPDIKAMNKKLVDEAMYNIDRWLYVNDAYQKQEEAMRRAINSRFEGNNTNKSGSNIPFGNDLPNSFTQPAYQTIGGNLRGMTTDELLNTPLYKLFK